jgi:hypothetical protein
MDGAASLLLSKTLNVLGTGSGSRGEKKEKNN